MKRADLIPTNRLAHRHSTDSLAADATQAIDVPLLVTVHRICVLYVGTPEPATRRVLDFFRGRCATAVGCVDSASLAAAAGDDDTEGWIVATRRALAAPPPTGTTLPEGYYLFIDRELRGHEAPIVVRAGLAGLVARLGAAKMSALVLGKSRRWSIMRLMDHVAASIVIDRFADLLEHHAANVFERVTSLESIRAQLDAAFALLALSPTADTTAVKQRYRDLLAECAPWMGSAVEDRRSLLVRASQLENAVKFILTHRPIKPPMSPCGDDFGTAEGEGDWSARKRSITAGRTEPEPRDPHGSTHATDGVDGREGTGQGESTHHPIPES